MNYAANRERQNGPRRSLRCSAKGLVGFLLLLTFTGCTSLPQWWHNGLKVGPNYFKPLAPVESQWIDYGRDSRVIAEPVNTCAWWTVFNDPTLNGLIETASVQNLTLRETGTRILQAQATRDIAAGNLFPQVQQAFGSYDTVQVSKTIANSPPNKNFDVVTSGLGASWEIDFWGRYRRAIEAADASLDATIEGYDNVLVLLLSDVATTYVEIRTLQEQLRLVRENVQLQQESLRIAEAQFDAGQADAADTLQTRNNVEQTEALIPQLETACGRPTIGSAFCWAFLPAICSRNWARDPSPPPRRKSPWESPPNSSAVDPTFAKPNASWRPNVPRIGVAEAELYPHFAIAGACSGSPKTWATCSILPASAARWGLRSGGTSSITAAS